ncbi:hypothetical protein KKE60_08420, partial [Patescibacteria group bacterium]|nr:hypothetical protein [Patescibacteria group bacterium]
VRFKEEDQTAPAGLFRIRVNGDVLIFERAAAADWSSDTDILTISATGGINIGSIAMDDDEAITFGGVVSLLYETADANANDLVIALPNGGATDVPVIVIGDQSVLNTNLGNHNGLVEPTVAIYNAAANAYISIDAGDDAVASAKGIYFKAADDEDIEIINLSVTGTPRIFWDETADAWGFNKGLIFTAGEIDGATIDSAVAKGTWTASGTWTISGLTLISLNAGAVQTATANTVLHVAGADSTVGRILIDTYAGDAALTFRRAAGTAASPSAVQSGELLGELSMHGYGATGYSANGAAHLQARADGNWTDASEPTRWIIDVTPAGSTISVEAMMIKSNGWVGLNQSTPLTRFHIKDTHVAGIGIFYCEGITHAYLTLDCAAANETGIILKRATTRLWQIKDIADVMIINQGSGAENDVFTLSSTNTVFNEMQNDIDFRIESNGNEYAFSIDASLNTVGTIGIGRQAVVDNGVIVGSTIAITATANQSYYRFNISSATAAVTVPAGTAPYVASALVNEPNITATGTVTVAASLLVSGAPTEGVTNAAIYVASGDVRFVGTTPLYLGLAGTATGGLNISGATSGTVLLTVAATAGTWTMTLPPDNGDAGEQLQTDGAGVTIWEAAGSMTKFKDIHSVLARQNALDAILGTVPVLFNYRRTCEDGSRSTTTGDYETEYAGVLAEDAPWVMHHNGRIFSPVSAFGYTVAAVQALHDKIADLESKIAILEGGN